MAESHSDTSLLADILETLVTDNGSLDKVVQMLFNRVMLLEREQHLNAQAYERTENRTGYANRFKPKSLKTRTGVLQLQVPQTRDGAGMTSCSKRLLKI